MAYSSFKSVVNTLPPPMQRLMHNPAWWAVVASVGMHGLIFALLPFMSLPSAVSQEPDPQERVSVIELSPDELSRVPDFSTPSRDLPPIPSGDAFTSFDDFLDLPSSPPASALPPQPEPLPSQRIPLWQIPTPRRFTLNPPRINPPTQTQPPTTESPPTTPPANNNTNPPANSTESTNPPPETEPNTNTDDQAARNTQDDADTQTPAERLLEEQEKLQQEFVYRAPTGEEISSAIAAWNSAATEAGYDQGEPVEPLTIPNMLLTCQVGSDITVLLGLVIGPNGNVLEEPPPQVLLGSGYEFFDKQAQDLILSHEFEAKETPWTSAAEVVFEYDEEQCP